MWYGYDRFVKKRTVRPAFLLLCAVNLCVVAGFGQSSDKRPQPGAPQPTLNEVLSWLPDDTETITGANGPFRVPDFNVLSNTEPSKMHRETRSDGSVIERPEFETQQVLRSDELKLRMRALTLGLFGFKNGGLREMLKGKTIALAVEGSRHFRTPTGLGQMRYEGCEIVVFSGAATPDRDSFMKNAASSAKRFENIEGVNVAVFEEESEEDLWTTFVGFPRSNVVLVATDADFLRTVLARMRGAGGPRALPDSLPEWKYVNARAPAWGLRHYQRSQAELDPTSPFHQEEDGKAEDDKAVGVTFWFEAVTERTAIVTYLSSSNNARQTLPNYLSLEDAEAASPLEFQIRLTKPAPGVTRGSVKLFKPEALYRVLFGLMAMLGHAVLV